VTAVRLTLRRLASHWKLKLAALAGSVLLWVVFSSEQITTQWIAVRVEPVVRNPAYVLTGGPDPQVVRVRFRGAGRELWEAALRPPTLVLPVRDVGPSRSFALEPQMVDVPESYRGVTALDVRPGVVRLDLERLATRVVPVRPVLGPRSRQRFAADDGLVSIPREVRLSGPEGVVTRVDTVLTLPIDPSGDGAVSARVRLDTTDLEGVRIAPAEVYVRGRVHPRPR
jgi:hypothetical protein